MADTKTYSGKDIDVTWDKRLCIHIGECGRAKGDLFVGGRDPWCDPDVTEVPDVEDVVQRCPTGAISFKRGDGSTEQAPDRNMIHVANHGPLYLRGDLDIEGAADDMPGVRTRAALCRCGLSKNKPFCDNTHETGGFQDRGAVGDAGSGYAEEGGTLKVSLAKDGPLLLKGACTMVGAGGISRWKGEKTALCRCGASKNKPFCDGAHKAAGFKG